MLTRGNHKLGGRLIWSFSLPSARPDICTGMTDLCRHHCYSRRLESIRPAMRARYEANWRLSRSPAFERRVRAFLVAHGVAVVRLHVGGDFPTWRYARRWLRIMRRMRRVRFFCYTRAWRDAAIRPLLRRMARLGNVRVWYSCDRETGLPSEVPARVRLAWLQTGPGDQPPPGTGLVFRVRGLRSRPAGLLGGARVCPAEDGQPRPQPVTCERCGLCWHPLPEDRPPRFPLPVVRPPG